MKSINLTCKPIFNGIMAYWEPVKDAARYIVQLYINNEIISERVNERAERYVAFSGLASLDCGWTLEAHNVGFLGGQSYLDGLSLKSEPNNSNEHYYIKVNAENRSGDIIAESEKVMGIVKEL